MPAFELSRLDSYDDASLLAELQRVSSLTNSSALTRSEFDRYSKASASLIARRFGGWARALELAGIGHRFSGTPAATRTIIHGPRRFSDDELLAELRSVAEKLGSNTVTIAQFNQHGSMNPETIRRRFGSWRGAVERAGLTISNLGKRYSESEYFENLLKVWTHYGRQPTYGEMSGTPSSIRAKAYEAKWGTWRSALKAFLVHVDTDIAASVERHGSVAVPKDSRTRQHGSKDTKAKELVRRMRRDVSLGLRYDVLRRDRFRCVICGASPASDIGCQLNVDHITPVALGGTTVVENLRTLCSECNIGKGAKVEQG